MPIALQGREFKKKLNDMVEEKVEASFGLELNPGGGARFYVF